MDISWFQNPTIAAITGAIVGSVISIIGSVYIWRRTQKVKRLDCFIRDISSLLSISDQIKDELVIQYAGKIANSVYLISIDIINTGNMSITNQPVRIRLSEGSNIIDHSVKTTPPVGFGDVKLELQENNSLDLLISLLNPEDKVTIELVSLDNPSENIDVYLKNADVSTRVLNNNSDNLSLLNLTSDKNLMLLAIMSSIPFFGGFARSMINVGVAHRIGKLNK